MTTVSAVPSSAPSTLTVSVLVTVAAPHGSPLAVMIPSGVRAIVATSSSAVRTTSAILVSGLYVQLTTAWAVPARRTEKRPDRASTKTLSRFRRRARRRPQPEIPGIDRTPQLVAAIYSSMLLPICSMDNAGLAIA